MIMHPLIARYNQVAVPKLKEVGSYSSTYLIPHITKTIINIGIGDLIGNSKGIEEVTRLLSDISGQKPVETKSRKAISGFKIRQNVVVGLKVTLRGRRMHDFLLKLIEITLPRTRDFRGLSPESVTGDGNLNVGIKDSMIFPEAPQDLKGHGLQVTIVSTAKSREESKTLYESMGFVFSNISTPKKKTGKSKYKK